MVCILVSNSYLGWLAILRDDLSSTIKSYKCNQQKQNNFAKIWIVI